MITATEEREVTMTWEGGHFSVAKKKSEYFQGRNKMYMICNERTRGEKRRRDADDFDSESKLMRKIICLRRQL